MSERRQLVPNPRQPNDAAHLGLVGEDGDKAGKIDLRPVNPRDLEAQLERLRLIVLSDRRETKHLRWCRHRE